MTSMVTNSRHGKKRLSPPTDGDYAEKGRKLTAAAEKWVEDKKSTTGEERLSSASTHISDLPYEVLSIILHYTGNYEEIARLTAVCHRFDAVFRELLLSAYSKLEASLPHCCT
jgi:hypothetical protein